MFPKMSGNFTISSLYQMLGNRKGLGQCSLQFGYKLNYFDSF